MIESPERTTPVRSLLSYPSTDALAFQQSLQVSQQSLQVLCGLNPISRSRPSRRDRTRTRRAVRFE